MREIGTIDEAVPPRPGRQAGLLGRGRLPRLRPGPTRSTSTSAPPRTTGSARPGSTGGRLGAIESILTGIPIGHIHDGGRLAFGPDGFLYASTGETGAARRSPRTATRPAGKILRITPDGEPAPGNPFDSPVWSYGHRNVQGLAFVDDGQLWASEFGQNTFDELNRIERAPTTAGRWSRAAARAATGGLDRPAGRLGDRRGLALRAGLPRRPPLDGRAARRAAVADPRQRRPRRATRSPTSSASTAGCAPSSPPPTATCGSPPATATAAASPRDGDDRILLIEP